MVGFPNNHFHFDRPVASSLPINEKSDSLLAIDSCKMEIKMIVNMLPELMQIRGLSIRELSRRTGVTYTTIRAVYHGERRSIKLDVLDAICQSLGVQPGEIFKFVPPGGSLPETGPEQPAKPPVDREKRPQGKTIDLPGGSDAWVTWD
jgi:putative transcriptional regulator